MPEYRAYLRSTNVSEGLFGGHACQS